MVKVTPIATFDGQEIREAVLEDANQAVHLMSFGAATRDWRVEANGTPVPIVLGFPRFEDYPEHSRSFGIIAGRVANRTAFGRFEMRGKAHQLTINNGAHHLHGGVAGFGKRNWALEADSLGNAVELSYRAEDGEEGYPGALDVRVVVSLKDGVLRYEMTAEADQMTPVNLAQHNYYNLSGQGDVRGHLLEIKAPEYSPVDDGLIPLGAHQPVDGTRFDFLEARAVGTNDPERLGVDHNLVLDPVRKLDEPTARLISPDTGIMLEVVTDQPGIQMFNAPLLDVAVPGHERVNYGAFGGLCLEAQHFPNYLNQPDWPQSFAEPGKPYRQVLELKVSQ